MAAKEFRVFVYDFVEIDSELHAIALYKDHDVVFRITEFYPWVYAECGSSKSIRDGFVLLVKRNPDIVKSAKVVKRHLYYNAAANNNKKQDLVFIRFQTIEARTLFLRNTRVVSISGQSCTPKYYDTQASSQLQLCTQQSISPVGYVSVTAYTQELYKGTVVSVLASDLRPCTDHVALPPIRVLSFDIEAYSSNPNRMPDAKKSTDRVFQISLASSTGEKVLLTLGETFPIDGVDIKYYNTEQELLCAFAAEIVRINPAVIIGYNIFRFDWPYLIERARQFGILDELCSHGANGMAAKQTSIRWSSAAFAAQEFVFVDGPGRVNIDLYAVVQRDYKLDNYRLKTVASHFLHGSTKDPVTPAAIFAAFELFMYHTQHPQDPYVRESMQTALTKVGKYCVMDSVLVLDLFTKLDVLIGTIEMSKVMNVTMSQLYTRGMQLRVFSQLYKLCYSEKRVINRVRNYTSSSDVESESYTGAYVFTPKAGVYKRVVSFDFNSLYPSTQICYNICPSTYIDPSDTSVSDDDCHVIMIDSHIGCEHDPDQRKNVTVVCTEQKARFLKTPQGVLPRLLSELLDARKKTRKLLAEFAESDSMAAVLNQRQLALKVSANSIYGSLGASQGFAPFTIGAAATTAAGRHNIAKAAEYITTIIGANLVYGYVLN